MAKLISVYKSVDKFGDSIGFKVRNGESSFKTIPGAILSLVIYLLIVIYGSTKF